MVKAYTRQAVLLAILYLILDVLSMPIPIEHNIKEKLRITTYTIYSSIFSPCMGRNLLKMPYTLL